MKPFLVLWMLVVLLLPVFAGPSDESSTEWTAVEVPRSGEAGSVKLLESRGVPAISWSNAMVEVSAFERVEARPISTLESTLTPGDPRWDPWLRALKPVFLSGDSGALIWIPATRRVEAMGLLGVGGGAPEVSSPRRTTGWLIAGFSLLYLIFRLAAEFLGSPRWKPWWKHLWLPVCVAVLIGGVVLTGGSASPGRMAQAKVPVSWLRHLWFQEAWPYGARWDDWAPGKPWAYRAYGRRDGRIVESSAALTTPDSAWAEASYRGLDPHGAARLFPRENP